MDTYIVKGQSKPEKISAADYQIMAPGLQLKVKDYGREMPVMRSESGLFDEDVWLKACSGGEVKAMRTFEIELEDAAQAKGKKRSDGSLEMTVEAPMKIMAPSNPQRQSAILHEDESGQLRWVLPHAKSEDGTVEEFELPPVPAGRVHRGPITKKIRRIVKVVAWLADDVVGHVALNLVRAWENKNRPYGLLGYDNGQLVERLNVDRLKAGKCLLMLHGTFSTGPSAFAGLLADDVARTAIEQYYQGRVFAFNHPSLHADPAGNIQELNALLPEELRGHQVDILTHSRGGLVGRELMAQTQAGQGPMLNVNKAILVAAPNVGTILTNRDHWITLIDTYTNLISKLPDNALTIILEGLIGLVKILAGSAVKALPGLQAMLPEGEYVKGLDQRALGDSQIYTMGARYLPAGDGVIGLAKSYALKVVLQKLFGEDSDMV
ncbi:MAG: alpha/beta hydrolase, partial [Bacteroidota bacterium]